VSAVAIVLMAAGVAVQALCVAGVAVMRKPLARLHYTGPSSLAAILIMAGLIVEEGVTALTARAMLIAALVAVANPIVSHVTAHAIRVRELRR
jgi:multisubunit Na+/H+ antiporter MnhG subunit